MKHHSMYKMPNNTPKRFHTTGLKSAEEWTQLNIIDRFLRNLVMTVNVGLSFSLVSMTYATYIIVQHLRETNSDEDGAERRRMNGRPKRRWTDSENVDLMGKYSRAMRRNTGLGGGNWKKNIRDTHRISAHDTHPLSHA